MRVCFVCSGNICRSPTAEVVMQQLVDDAGLAGEVALDSAGTGAWHVGEPADERTRRAASRRGLHIRHRARQLAPSELATFDLLVAMDQSHLAHLQQLALRHGGGAKLALLRSFDPASEGDLDVPDPYYGDPSGFELVLDQCQAACRGLLTHLLGELRAPDL
ncbi:MAG: low molecular weight phosphotyrosine protein phosphatase [Myxococcales bacterium]|nr:low molecular weight phosphotyrosine protein phosphatase [Myxococcales bacterium]